MAVFAVMPAQAQNEDGEESGYEYTFNRHWFIQGQFGGQYTLGEVSFTDLLSLDAELAVGYEFTPVIAGRFSINAWKSKAGSEGKYSPDGKQYDWSWNYIAPSVDVMFDLTNLIGGFKPRKINAGVLAGIGLNIPFGKDKVKDARNDMIAAYNAAYPYATAADPDYVDNKIIKWADDKGPYVVGRVGAYVDWHITDNLALGLELQANTLSDKYNSKQANNWDWYFNCLVGVKYCFGTTYTKEPAVKMIPISDAANYAPKCNPEDNVVVKEVEKVVEKTVAKSEVYEEVYFLINKHTYEKTERYKIEHIVEVLKNDPNAKISISAYADSATGTSAYNQKISERRAETVKKALLDAGIDESRITTAAHGSSFAVHQDDISLNRVCICVVK